MDAVYGTTDLSVDILSGRVEKKERKKNGFWNYLKTKTFGAGRYDRRTILTVCIRIHYCYYYVYVPRVSPDRIKSMPPTTVNNKQRCYIRYEFFPSPTHACGRGGCNIFL